MIKISVIMPCYNASRFIGEAIRSVQSQTFTDWELLIIDDGSTDNSARIGMEFAASDSRIKLIQQPNSGACRARNNGIKHAQGEYVKFLDADDILCTDCLAEQLEQIEKLQPNQIPFGYYGNIDDNGNVCSEYHYSKEHLSLLNEDQVYAMFRYWQILISAPLHRKELLKRVNGYDEDLPRHQETDFHFRLALADVQFVYYPTLTFYYREYTSTSRITSNYRSGKISEEEVQREIYVPKRELALNAKYPVLPQQYRSYFTNRYFSFMRYYYAHKQIEKANQSKQKVLQYGSLTAFMRTYMSVGKIIGFTYLESLLQQRLKLIGKK